MRLLLDTNAYTDLMRGEDAVTQCVRRATEVLMSTIVVGELLYGFLRGSRRSRNTTQLDDFLTRSFVQLLPVTRITADRFGKIAASLRDAGTPIPTNDIWIAAHALESGADLLSRDAHFERVAGLMHIHPHVRPDR